MRLSLGAVREIMGAQYIDIAHAEQYFKEAGIERFFEGVPFRRSVLKVRASDNYVLSPYPAVSVYTLKKANCALFDIERDNCFYEDETFYTEIFTPGWHLIAGNVLEGSMGVSRKKRLSLLPENHSVPNPSMLLFTMIGYFQSTGIKLFEGVFAQTSTCLEDGAYICIGWTKKGILIGTDSGKKKFDTDIGLAIERVPSE